MSPEVERLINSAKIRMVKEDGEVYLHSQDVYDLIMEYKKLWNRSRKEVKGA